MAYEMFDRMQEVCDQVRSDLMKRLVKDPDPVELLENGFLFEIITRVPDANWISALKEKLIQYDKETNYGTTNSSPMVEKRSSNE